MDFSTGQRGAATRLPGVTVIVLLHIAIAYALISGLARKVVEVIKAPIETKIIEEIKKPPPDVPPPPPPRLQAPPPPFIPPPEINIQLPPPAPAAITTVTTTPPPPGPPPVAVPVEPAAPVVRREFKPSHRIDPSFPRRAVDRGISGRVVAWVYVATSGQVTQVEIRQSSNRIFDPEVVRALSQWRFKPEPVGFIGEYAITFNIE